MKLEYRNVFSLKLDPNNARQHDDINLEAISKSLDRFGQQKPIVINKSNVVIAGNGTLMAAKKLDWQEIAVVVAPETWTEAEAKAYAIADNRTHELSKWDNEQLLDTISELPDELILAAGFSQETLDELLKTWSETPDLGDLLDEGSDSGEDSGMVRISFVVPEGAADRWNAAVENAGKGSTLLNTVAAINAAFEKLSEVN